MKNFHLLDAWGDPWCIIVLCMLLRIVSGYLPQRKSNRSCYSLSLFFYSTHLLFSVTVFLQHTPLYFFTKILLIETHFCYISQYILFVYLDRIFQIKYINIVKIHDKMHFRQEYFCPNIKIKSKVIESIRAIPNFLLYN